MTYQLTLESAAPSKLEQAFHDFHGRHPEVYDALVRLALAKYRAGATYMSAKTLYGQVREGVGVTDLYDLKLDNNFTAYYARLLVAHHPELKGVLRFRQQRQQATFGPRNEGLEPNEHRS